MGVKSFEILQKSILVFLIAILLSTILFSQNAANQSLNQTFRIFYGNLHSHTAFSDGKGTPEEAYKHGANYGDFLAVTDHCYFLKTPVNGQSKTILTQKAAREATKNGKFVGLQGFEWTAGSGHINVFETTEFISRDEKGDLKDFYDWIIKSQKLAQFNHPGMTFGNFQDFWFIPQADKYVNLIEIGNGSSISNDTISDEMYKNYILALNRGWHVSPTANQDNHRQNWISANDSRTGVLAKSLVYEDIMEALWNRRTFASEDRNVKIYFYASNNDTNQPTSQIMGGVLEDATQVTLTIIYEDIGDPVKELWVVSQSSKVKLKEAVGHDKFELFKTFIVPDGYEWYFVKIVQADGDEIVTAPVWIESSKPFRVNYLRIGPENPKEGQTLYITYDVYNTSEEKITGKLAVYLNGKLLKNDNVTLNGYEIKYDESLIIEPSNLHLGNNVLEFHFDDQNIQSINFEVSQSKGLTVLVDKIHENDITPELKLFLEKLGNEGHNVIYTEIILADYSGIDAIIIASPSVEGLSFFKELMPQEVEWLNNFDGKIFLIRGSDEEYFEIYSSAIKNKEIIEDISELYKVFQIYYLQENTNADEKSGNTKNISVELPKVVYIDQGHSNDYLKDKLTLLDDYLKSMGYSVKYINRIEKLSGQYLIIMNGKDYNDAEIKNIAEFVRNGGKLIITSKSDYRNGGNTEDLNLILDYMNSPVRFNDDQVIDEINNYGANYKVVVENVRFYSACSLVIYGDSEILLASTTATSIDADNQKDAVTVGKNGKIVLAASFSFGKGKVIAIGKAIFSDYDFIINKTFIQKLFQ